MKLTMILVAAALASPLLANDPAKVDGFAHIRTVGGVAEYRLESNGLRVLLMQEKSAPVVTFMVTYHVGSRNEVTGTTGATHLLEHLMFKGTPRFDRSLGTGYDQMLERVGAETNATTWLDRTNYFATVPSNALPLLVELEADRMRNLTLREEDRRPEMTVVRNEYERGENNPLSALDKEMWAAAFMAHPYQHDTIGWRSDIERVPISKLREFYDTFYWPDNATATLIGDFDPATALAVIRQHYGAIPKSPHPFPEIYTVEPEQTGQRRVKIERAGELGIVAIAHKIPQATHPDWPALQVASAILTRGRTSRLYRELTDKNLTLEVSGFCAFNRDPSLHLLYAELAADISHENVEKTLLAEIAKLREQGPTPEEVGTAVAGLLAERAYESDGTFATAALINECIAVGDWALFTTLKDKFRAVTATDVKRVAATYLVDRRSVVGWFVPGDAGENPFESGNTNVDANFPQKEVLPPKAPERELDSPAKTNFATRTVRRTIQGADVLVCPTGVQDVVTIRGSLRAGSAAAENRALAPLAAGMIERGTTKRLKFAIAALLEKVGATLDFQVTADTVEFTGRSMSADVPLLAELIIEQLRMPAFDAEEFSKLKKQLASEARQSLDDTDAQAAIAFSQTLYPIGHPQRRPSVAEFLSMLEKTDLAAVREFHQHTYTPNSLRIVAVGDLEANKLHVAIETAMQGWSGPAIAETPTETPKPAATTKTIAMADKTSVSVCIGQTSGLTASDSDWLPLQVATRVLGRGFTSRLVGTVRDKEGLTYGITAAMTDDTYRSGTWLVKATFSPALLDQGLASTRREIAQWHRKGITADELAYRKSAIAGQFAVSLETTGGLAEQLLRCVERGFPLTWLDTYPQELRALTLDQVNAAIRKHLDPAAMSTIMAGTLPAVR